MNIGSSAAGTHTDPPLAHCVKERCHGAILRSLVEAFYAGEVGTTKLALCRTSFDRCFRTSFCISNFRFRTKHLQIEFECIDPNDLQHFFGCYSVKLYANFPLQRLQDYAPGSSRCNRWEPCDFLSVRSPAPISYTCSLVVPGGTYQDHDLRSGKHRPGVDDIFHVFFYGSQ